MSKSESKQTSEFEKKRSYKNHIWRVFPKRNESNDPNNNNMSMGESIDYSVGLEDPIGKRFRA
jgi:hypothetical protein